MKISFSLFLLGICLTLGAQDSPCAHELEVAPSQEQIQLERELFLNPNGTFAIVKEFMSVEKADALLAELNAAEESGEPLDERYQAISTVLNCLKENELID